MDDAWSKTTAASRALAMRRVGAVNDYRKAKAQGLSKTAAADAVALIHNVAPASIYRWQTQAVLMDAERTGRPACIWLQAGAENAWSIWLTDYLRLEAPASMACYRRVQAIASVRGWIIPAEVAFRRRLKKEVSPAAIARAREGTAGLLSTHPRQQRSVANIAPLDWLCGDGRKHDLWVTPAGGGKPVRPVVWYWQDVYSRRILGFRCGLSESAEVVRLALSDVCKEFGVPHHVLIDNTRAVSAKWLSGGSLNRKRWHSSTENVPGIFALLGIQSHHTGMEYSAAGKGIGRGWAKPIERAFRDLAEAIDKHPLAAGAYTGRSTLTKPENYGTKALPWQQFEALIAQCVQEHNAQTNRRTEAAAGDSFNDAWSAKIATTPIRKLTTAQQALLLLAVETAKIKRDGTLTLVAGRGARLAPNRYHHPDLLAHAGKHLVARFDPDQLHGDIHVYDTKGRYICQAQCILAVGFSDSAAAKAHRRAQMQHKRAVAAELAALDALHKANAPPMSVLPAQPAKIKGEGGRILQIVPNSIDMPQVQGKRQKLRALLAAGRKQQIQDGGIA